MFEFEPVNVNFACQLHYVLDLSQHPQRKNPEKSNNCRARQRIDVVGVVKGIEHFEASVYQRHTFSEPEWTLNTPVEREVVIVLALTIAICSSPASRRCNGLRCNDPVYGNCPQFPNQVRQTKEVELCV